MTTRLKATMIALAASLVAAMGASASTGKSAMEVFSPREGFSRTIGSKQAVGYFETQAGRCAVTLMIAEVYGEDSAGAPAFAARLRLALAPSQSFDFDSAEARGFTISCGPGAATLAIATPEVQAM